MNKKNWITSPYSESCVTFKNTIILKKNAKHVLIDITAMGWFNLFVNKKRIDKVAFAPGWTDYLKRVQFNTFDITDNLVDSKIELSVDVGNGWANAQRLGCGGNIPAKPSYFYKSLIYEIRVTYEDGTEEEFVSDENVDIYTNDVTFNDIYDGETQDSLRKIEYLGKAKYTEIDADIIPQEGEDIVFSERLIAKEMFVDADGNTVIDFGQNFTGNIEINIDGKDGEIISFTPGEVLDERGVFYNKNYRSAKSTFTFILSNNKKIYMSKFSFMGGRYIKLIQFPKRIRKENFTGVLIHSKMEKTCFFECGNEDLQRLYLNNVYGHLSNYLDVPTDCPQRDERLGWTADTQVFASTAAINYNVDRFLSKWIGDVIADQGKNGEVLGFIPLLPNSSWAFLSTGWGDCATIVPYELYKAYKDVDILKKSVDMMEKWVNLELSKFKKPYIVSFDFAFGDWCALDKGYGNDSQGLTRFDLVDTAFTANSLSILIETLDILGRDSSKYVKIFENIKKAYRKEFIENGHMIGPRALMHSMCERTANTQTGIILTLQFNLCEEKDRNSLLNDLVENIKDCETRLTTGFLGTPYILHALSDNGRGDIAYDLLLQTRYPSWLYSVKKGATTFWEHYDGIQEDGTPFPSGMNSYNHYAYGCVFNWMYRNISGINIVKAGYEEILIRPRPDKRIGYVQCKYKSKFGFIESNWKYLEDGSVRFEIAIPKGVAATVEFPDGNVRKINGKEEITYICY